MRPLEFRAPLIEFEVCGTEGKMVLLDLVAALNSLCPFFGTSGLIASVCDWITWLS